MASVSIATLLIVAGSVAIGHAICALGGWTRSWLSPAVGFAALLVAGGAVQFAPGHAQTMAILVVAAAVGATRVRGPGTVRRAELMEGLAVALGVFLLSSLPLIVSGRAGILGAGNQNDMVVHLTTADWLRSHDGAATSLVGDGYPIGPHGVAAMVSQATGMSLVHAFDGVTLAIPVLTALAALAALGGLPRPHRLVVASMSALCYLAASYLVTGAFKETAEALLLLAFVLALRRLPDARPRWVWLRGVPLGVLAAGTIYVYSYLGVVWLVAAAALYAFLELVARRGTPRERARRLAGAVAPAAGAAFGFVVTAWPQAGRVLEFSQSSFAHEPKANTGNLVDGISPLQAFGVWLRSDFRFDMPFGLTLGIGVVVVAAGLLAMAWWMRRRDFALPAGVVSAALIYWASTINKNVYNQAKGLAIAAPLVALMVGAALAAWSAQPRGRNVEETRARLGHRVRLAAMRAGALALLCAAAVSSFIALRDGPVSADAHASDLRPVRTLVRGQPTLNMDQDNFPLVPGGRGPRDGAAPVPDANRPPRPGKPWRATQPLDFDSWSAGKLNQFRYVVEPRSAYRSATPPGFELARRTRWFWVWERTRKVHNRSVIEHGGHPAAVLQCGRRWGRAIARRQGVASVSPRPVVRDWRAWRGQPRLLAGQSAQLTVHLPPGKWDLSLQYSARWGSTFARRVCAPRCPPISAASARTG